MHYILISNYPLSLYNVFHNIFSYCFIRLILFITENYLDYDFNCKFVSLV